MNENMTTIWARMGVSIKISLEEMHTLAYGSQDEKESTLATVFSQGRAEISGDSYIPSNIIAEYNRKYGTDFFCFELDLKTDLIDGKKINVDAAKSTLHKEIKNDSMNKQMPQLMFEYGGFHFIPERKFTSKENDFSKISHRQRVDVQMGLCKPGYAYESRFPYSYESFMAASPVKDCDLFRCVENGRLYLPCINDLQQYMEKPIKRRDAHER